MQEDKMELPSRLIGKGEDPKRTQLVVRIENSWRFVSPNSFIWKNFNSFADVTIAEERIGIVMSNTEDPTMIVEFVEVGEELIRDVILSTYNKGYFVK